MKVEFTGEELGLLNRIVETAVRNSNSVKSVPIVVKGQEYRTLCGIWNKLKEETPAAGTARESK